MPEPARMIEAVKTYCRAETEGDREAFMRLFADDVMHEDPVPLARRHGAEGLAELWEMSQASNVDLRLESDVIVCGNEAIGIMRAETGPPGQRRVIAPIIDHFVFNEDGKIASVRAFYNFG